MFAFGPRNAKSAPTRCANKGARARADAAMVAACEENGSCASRTPLAEAGLGYMSTGVCVSFGLQRKETLQLALPGACKPHPHSGIPSAELG